MFKLHIFLRNFSMRHIFSSHFKKITNRQITQCSSFSQDRNQIYSSNEFYQHFNSKKFMSKFSPFNFDTRNNRGLKNNHRVEEVVCTRLFSLEKETSRKVHKKIQEIKENILTVPNALCALRIMSTPFLGYLVYTEYYATSLGIFVLAGFTDILDGYIARTFPSQQTMIGSFLDPAADKLLIATLFITLTVKGFIPIMLTSMIILRDLCLFGAGFYIRYVSLPPPKTLSRYFDMSFVTAKLSPTGISKMNTLIQLCLVGASLAAPVFSYVDHTYLHYLWYLTGTTTVLSAASYLYYNNETYKLFTKLKDK